MSPRRNLDSPSPSPASEWAPAPEPKGGGAHSPAGEGVGESQFRRLEKKHSTLSTLCGGRLGLATLEGEQAKPAFLLFRNLSRAKTGFQVHLVILKPVEGM
jgi:hypothetical protein